MEKVPGCQGMRPPGARGKTADGFAAGVVPMMQEMQANGASLRQDAAHYSVFCINPIPKAWIIFKIE